MLGPGCQASTRQPNGQTTPRVRVLGVPGLLRSAERHTAEWPQTFKCGSSGLDAEGRGPTQTFASGVGVLRMLDVGQTVERGFNVTPSVSTGLCAERDTPSFSGGRGGPGLYGCRRRLNTIRTEFPGSHLPTRRFFLWR